MISVGSKSNTNNQEIDLGLSDKSDPNEQGDLFGNIFLSINVNQENEISLEKHLNILASDSLEGRETGKPGQKNGSRLYYEPL